MTQGFEIDEDALKQAEWLFRQQCDFIAGVQNPEQMIGESLPEVAFAGRSNVGKSSLINALTGRKTLARASQTPGRTQQINFFDLGGQLLLVDLPGYGYAAAAKHKITAWNEMIGGYLSTRESLKRVFVLVDARHGFKDSDREAMAMLDEWGVPYIVIMTKCDKVKPAELAATKAAMETEMKNFPNAFPVAHETSADTKHGIAELRAIVTLV
jgi:GTP-binding protein